MIRSKKMISLVFDKLLSDNTRKIVERVTLNVAITSFILHLAIIYIVQFHDISFLKDSGLFENPISAIYTPFSFILIYEVYLLIYYLSTSFTTYITKQYEIITLIIIRKLFKDLSSLELTSNWFEIKGDLQFTYDLLASLLLFYLIYEFQRRGRQKIERHKDLRLQIERFVNQKKLISVVLIPLFFGIAIYTLVDWFTGISISATELKPFESINNLFFDQFFTVLILVDVVLLLISFFYTDTFHKIIRNSGFIVSTILIRMSFGVSGLISTVLILVAVIFGLIIIIIHNKYEKNLLPEKVDYDH
jgi:hypothetical protein